MIFNRAALAQFISVARGETRHALAGAPDFAWRLLGVVAWGLFAMLMGAIVGVAAVALPPMGLAAIIAVFGLVLLWVMPEGFTPPDKLIRSALFVFVVVQVTIPVYYTADVPGLPWISARRLITFILIVLFSLGFSTSVEARARIIQVFKDNKPIVICVSGLFCMIFLSIFTSIEPLRSVGGLVEAILEWMVPFFATLYVIREDKDVDKVVRIICWCALVISFIGVIEYFLHYRPYLLLIPKSVLAKLVQDNQSFMVLITEAIRNGQYRASSVFIVPLSFAEFEAVIAPLGAVYLIEGKTTKDKVFGLAVIAACLLGIFVSGSRGGYLSLFVAAAVMFALMVVRQRLFQPRTLSAPILGVIGVAGFCLVAAAVAFIGRINRTVFGGGQGAMSDEGRRIQWRLAWPKILANPVTGHGFAESGLIVGYYPVPGGTPTVDSYVLTLIVETGIPSLAFYFGMALIAAWVGSRRYLRDSAWSGALAGGLACSIVAFAFYRIFLSQRENQTLFFILIACTMLLHSFFLRARERSKATEERS